MYIYAFDCWLLLYPFKCQSKKRVSTRSHIIIHTVHWQWSRGGKVGRSTLFPQKKSKWPMKCEVDLLFVISRLDKWKGPPSLLCLLAFCQHYKLQVGISWKAKQITTDLSNHKGNHGRTMKRITILVMASLDFWANKWEQKYLTSANLLTPPTSWYSEQSSKQSH